MDHVSRRIDAHIHVRASEPMTVDDVPETVRSPEVGSGRRLEPLGFHGSEAVEAPGFAVGGVLAHRGVVVLQASRPGDSVERVRQGSRGCDPYPTREPTLDR